MRRLTPVAAALPLLLLAAGATRRLAAQDVAPPVDTTAHAGADEQRPPRLSYGTAVGGMSFADGHSEIRKWQSATSKYNGVIFTYERPRMKFDLAGRTDYAWYLERTGYVEARNGAAAFQY